MSTVVSETIHSYDLTSKSFYRKHGFTKTFASFYLGLRATILPLDLVRLIIRKYKVSRSLEPVVSPLYGKSSKARHRRAKQLAVCHRCARWNCDGSNPRCFDKGIPSVNRLDKLEWIRGGLSTYHPDTETSPVVYNAQMQLYIERERSRVGLE